MVSSYGGNTPFTPAASSSYRVHDLGFGDFNGDGKTDVVGATIAPVDGLVERHRSLGGLAAASRIDEYDGRSDDRRFQWQRRADIATSGRSWTAAS